MKFLVTVQRVEYRDHVFEVEADDEEEAEEQALSEACNFDFKNASVGHADEQVTSIEPNE